MRKCTTQAEATSNLLELVERALVRLDFLSERRVPRCVALLQNDETVARTAEAAQQWNTRLPTRAAANAHAAAKLSTQFPVRR
jgi:hypothetical protein